MVEKGNFARQAKDLVSSGRHGVLNTLSVSQAGFPFGSVVPYDLTADGRIIIYVSLIAEHYKNLTSDSRASLTVVERYSEHQPQAFGRATVLANFVEADSSEIEDIRRNYEKRFPGSINYEIAHNFIFLVGRVAKVRWIGGFGAIGWVGGEAFRATSLDHIAYHIADIINHMNDDHGDALEILAKVHQAGDAADYQRAVMVAINSSGFVMRLYAGQKSSDIQISFAKTLSTAAEVRGAIIELVQEAKRIISKS